MWGPHRGGGMTVASFGTPLIGGLPLRRLHPTPNRDGHRAEAESQSPARGSFRCELIETIACFFGILMRRAATVLHRRLLSLTHAFQPGIPPPIYRAFGKLTVLPLQREEH